MRIKWYTRTFFRSELKIFSAKMETHLKYIYLLYATLGVVLTATITPAFQAPDERAHFLRAEQTSRGVLVAHFILLQPSREHRTSPDKRIIYPDSGGYVGQRGINLVAFAYDSIVAHKEQKVTDSLIKASKKYYWNENLTIVNFPNTGFYPPTGYVFPAIGILAGKLFRMNILDTLILSRILNGIGCAIICFFALGLAKRSRLILFFLLLLPLTIFLFASVSQDAMLISLAALIVGMIDHNESEGHQKFTKTQGIVLIICITAISVARPPYFIFASVFLLLQLTPRMKLLTIAIPFLSMVVWGILNSHNYAVAFAPPEMGVNAKMQLAFVTGHPLKFVGMFFQWNAEDILSKLREYVGILGWLDVVLPGYYYKLTYWVMLMAIIAVAGFNLDHAKLRITCIIAAMVTFIGIMAAQYITWMPLESPGLGGVQSRYFIPVVFFLMLGIAGFNKELPLKNWQSFILMIIVLFPVFSEVIMVNRLMDRYYLF